MYELKDRGDALVRAAFTAEEDIVRFLYIPLHIRSVWIQTYLLDELLLLGMFLSQIRDFRPQCFILPEGHHELDFIHIYNDAS